MVKRTIKIISLPIILAILTIIFEFNVDQTLFTWTIEKILIISTFLASFIAFPLYFVACKDREVSIYENFKKVKSKVYSFWKGILFVLAILLGYYLLFFAVFYFLLLQPQLGTYGGPSPMTYLLTTFFPYLLTVLFGIKYIFTPLISLFEDKGFFDSLWASKNRISFVSKVKLFFLLILFLILHSFLFAIIQYYFFSLVVLTVFNYLVSVFLLILFSYLILQNYQKLEEAEHKDSFVSKIKKLPTTFSFLVGIPFLLIFVFFTFAVSFLDYDPQFSALKGEEMEVEIKEPQRDGNLYYFLKEEGFITHDEEKKGCASLEVEDPGRLDVDSYIQFIKDNPQKTKNISEKNSKALDCILEAADKTHYNSPISFGEEFFKGNNFQSGLIFKLSRVNAFEIARLTKEEKDEEALERFVAGIKLGSLLSNQTSGPKPVEYLASNSVKAIHNNQFENINLSNIDKELLRKTIQKMEDLDTSKSVLDRMFKLEYMAAAYLVDHPAEIIKIEDFKNPYAKEFLSNRSYFYKPNETKRNFFSIYQRIIDKSEDEELPFSGKIFLSFDRPTLAANLNYNLPFTIKLAYQLPKPAGEYLMKSISGNWIGMVFNDAFLIDINPKKQYRELRAHQTSHHLKKIALAIELYKRNHNRLPDDLKQLSPNYISEIPEDPFNKGNTLNYSKEKKLIYSSQVEDVNNKQNSELIINLN